jgi:predicted AlkP superfamily phosphohydrolase/phosphomutase
MWHFRDATHRAHPADAPADFRNAIDACYEQVDGAIGEILASVDDQTTILVMSDHGFGPWEYWFHCNAWLLSQGFLVVKSDALSRLKYALFRLGFAPLTFYKLAMGMKMGEAVARTTLHRREWSFNLLRRLFISFDDVDWSRTTAYSLGNLGQIFLNRAGREPQGIVTDADYDAVLTRIVDRLREEKNPANCQPLMGEVLRGRDLYAGKRADEGPDLMPVPADPRILGFGTAQFTSQRLLTPAFGMTGGHRMDGVFIAAGRGIRGGQTVAGSRLWDVAPTIMALMGVPVPAGLDGRVLDSILTPGMRDQVRYDERPYQDYFHDGGQGYSEDEEALVAERLKGLGYV